MIIADRKQLLNGNEFILGVSGGGKSFAAKGEIVNQILSSDADVIIVDPEREYGALVNAFGGEVINISATSKIISTLWICPRNTVTVQILLS